MKMVYEFGDKIYYKSPKVDGLYTPCIFLRYDECGCAVIIFKNAEWTARVNPKLLVHELKGYIKLND